MTAKQLEQETGCKIMIRGKGSMRDKKKVSFVKIYFFDFDMWLRKISRIHFAVISSGESPFDGARPLIMLTNSNNRNSIPQIFFFYPR